MKQDVKIAPNSKESEMMVLGSMIGSINSFNFAIDSLEDIDFYYNEHMILFQALKKLYIKDSSIDLHLIIEQLKSTDQLQSVGGIPYLVSLSNYTGISYYIEDYIKIVKDKSTLRQIIGISEGIRRASLENLEDVSRFIDECSDKFYKIGQKSNSSHSVSIGDVLAGKRSESGLSFIEQIQKRQEHFLEHGTAITLEGVQSHFIDLDKLINGLGNSNLIIVASRPAMGKTAFAINIAENVCFKGNHPVGIFSLEMGAEQLIHRIICSQAEVCSEKIKNGSIKGDDYQKIIESSERIKHFPLFIDDQPNIKISDLRSRARRMKEAHGVKLIVIDYLQLISSSSSFKAENRQTEVAEISRMLKSLARELNIPILCLSQLSREADKRPGHRPMMSDLRESGSIEQDADIVSFLFRREYYDPHDYPGRAELIVAKNRHGSVGTVQFAFRKEFSQFKDYIFEKISVRRDEDDELQDFTR